MWFHVPGGQECLYMFICAFVGGYDASPVPPALPLSLSPHRLHGVTLPFSFSDRSSPPFITYMGRSHSL